MRDLPDHIWSAIFGLLQFLREPCDSTFRLYVGQGDTAGISTLSALCRTSQRFRRLAEPILYATLPAGWWKIRDQLLPVLAANQRLACLVRYISLGTGDLSQDSLSSAFRSAEQNLPLSQDLKAQLRETIHSSDRSHEACFPFYFALVPGVECAELILPSTCGLLCSMFGEARRQHDAEVSSRGQLAGLPPVGSDDSPGEQHRPHELDAAPPSHPLSRLREIRIRYADDEYALSLSNVREILSAPVLQTLRGSSIELDIGPPPTGAPLSSLQQVYLEDSVADAEGIENLLLSCQGALRVLRLHWGSATVGDSQLDFDAMGHALRQHGQNLETLDIDSRECFSYKSGEWSGKIRSLAELKHLRRLSLPLDILLGDEEERDPIDDSDADRNQEEEEELEQEGRDKGATEPPSLRSGLPANLETLHLYQGYDNEDLVRQDIGGLLRDSGQLKGLRKVTLDGCQVSDLDISETGWQIDVRDSSTVFTRYL